METIRNPRGNVAPEVPLKADGSGYHWELIHSGAKYRTLIGDYPVGDELEATAARIRYAVGTQVALQAMIDAEEDLSSCTPAERQLLLGSRHVPPQIEVWEADVPLVLVDTYYQPSG